VLTSTSLILASDKISPILSEAEIVIGIWSQKSALFQFKRVKDRISLHILRSGVSRLAARVAKGLSVFALFVVFWFEGLWGL
jgi:hypothetical protein